jgi:Protein of unknown function (DUF1549)/Protein of unknown function (DUF1553)
MYRPTQSHVSAALALLALVVAPLAAWAEGTPLRKVIDSEAASAWQREKITPAKPSDDSAFLRRVSLDLVGVIPTWEATVAFLEGKDPGKREKLIDALLADPRFAQHQADVWDLILFGRNPPGYDTYRRDGFQAWLRRQFEKNTPYDVWARELLKAEGNSVDDSALFYAQYSRSPEDASEAIAQTFLGIQLHCSRCHDHPHEQWTQRDFYGMAAFLSRLEVVTVGKKGNETMYAIGEKSAGDIQFTGPAKDAKPGQKGEPVKPKFLLGNALTEPPLPTDFKEVKFEANKTPPRPRFSRKDQLADWMTRADNPFFARAIANRLWAQYMGRGLVHPVSNLGPSSKASHPALLERLTRELIGHKFDLKWYIREIVNSETYQLSSSGGGEALPEWFQHGRMRPLQAEELVESWQVASGYLVVEKQSNKKPDGSRFRPLIRDYVIQFFGTPNNGTGDFQGGLHEHLFLNNGPLEQMISGGKGMLSEFVADRKVPMDARIERLFLASVNRRPTALEREKFAKFLASEKASGVDAVWVLLSCSEFRFNH